MDKKLVLVIDDNEVFCSDFETRTLLNWDDDLEYEVSSSLEDIDSQAEEKGASMIVLSRKAALSYDGSHKAVRCYAKDIEDEACLKGCGIPYYGMIKNTEDLIDKITRDEPSENKKKVKEEPKKEVPKKDVPKAPVKKEVPKEEPPQKKKAVAEDEDFDDFDDFFEEEEDDEDTPKEAEVLTKEDEREPASKIDDKADLTEALPQEAKDIPSKKSKEASGIRKRVAEARKAETEKKASKDAEADLNRSNKARIITFMSGKGGVGKTTLSCELATFLALSQSGADEGRNQVCIVDYNLDFGDVLKTLDYETRVSGITLWSEEIREMLDRGDDPEDIRFTKREIRNYLAKKEESGLYALLAPVSNVDSMEVGDQELEIMLRNLQLYGGFDYIICDTGNNTRDSTCIAIERADYAIVVLTQSVNTANCCNEFLNTLAKIDMDMNKFRVVVNMVRPKKNVDVDVDNLVENVTNPITDEPYKCIALIKDSDDVIRAGNRGVPLVYNSASDFKTSINKIAQAVAGYEFALAAPAKKSFFARLFKKGV